MRIVFIGTIVFSHTLAEHLRHHPQAEIVGVVTRAESRFNADCLSLAPLAAAIGCPCLVVDQDKDADMNAWIRALAPDVIYCFGWSWLLKPEVLSAAPLGVIGYHPALLPANRGRHPIIWALALGLAETGSSFFFMDDGADSGDLLDQERVAIGEGDDAASLYARLEEVARVQVGRFTTALADGTFRRQLQDHSRANSWRKRDAGDGAIDWRMPAKGIHNLVRALTRPYVGAHFRWAGEDVKVWRSRLGPSYPDNLEPGRVVAVENGEIHVKCGMGSLILGEYDAIRAPEVGEYLK